jgi:hypothetical protein
MHAFVPLKSAQLNAGRANARHAALDGAAPNVATSPAMKVQMKLRQAVNESTAVRALAQLRQALNQQPSVVAQRINSDVLSRRSIVQRYTDVVSGKFSGKRSQYGQYVTGHDLNEMYARPDKNVERSRKTGETAVIGGLDYHVWEPSFEVIQDCVAAMEELMHGEKLKYGAPELSLFRDSAASPTFFGDSDDRNRELGKETDLGPSANPDIMDAFLIARQEYKRDEARPQFHGATVVARDGNDSVTLETTAPLSGSISKSRVAAVYDMYSSSKSKAQSFKHAYQAEYGDDATVSVIEPVESLPDQAIDTTSSNMVVDYI